MADHRAIMAVAKAIVGLLRANQRPDDFEANLEFEVARPVDLATSGAADHGVTLLLYRATPFAAHRTPAGRIDAQGARRNPILPLELHFLLTVWAPSSELEHVLAAWAMRSLEDTPILPASLLNESAPGAFGSDEVVELALADLSNDDLLRVWDQLGIGSYRLSIPYLARPVRIESTRSIPETADSAVQHRTQQVATARLDSGAPR